MKHIIIFDIDNCHEDYSYLIENIELLNDIQWLSRNKLQGFFNIGKNKQMVKRCEVSQIPSVRYFECPRGEIVQTETSALYSNVDIIKKYYDEVLKNSKNDEETNKTVMSELSSIFYLDENGTTCSAKMPLSIRAQIHERQRISTARFISAVKSGNTYFHIRIKINEENLFDLQYLALLLIRFNDLVKQNRLSVVLLSDKLPLSYFPFYDYNNPEKIEELNGAHNIFSRYLRLLSKEHTGVIYAPKFIQKNNTIVPELIPMNYKISSAGSSFFPITIINEDTYNKLFASNDSSSDTKLSSFIKKENLWQSSSGAQNKKVLFNVGRLRFYNANSDDPKEAFLAYIAETSWNRLKQFIEGYDEFQKLIFKETVSTKFDEEHNNWLVFALFSFLYGTDDSNDTLQVDHQHIDRCYKMARELSAGLQQLMQNSVQHSKYKSCVFTFGIDNNKLRLYVVDINTNGTLIDTFKRRLSQEIAVLKNSNLIDEDTINGYNAIVNASNIKVSHFFNKFEKQEIDEKESWRKFRSADCTSHIGLLLFYQAVKHCCADFIVRSEDKYESTDGNSYVWRNDDQTENSEVTAYSKEGKRSIPGTQYLIALSLSNWNHEILSGGASISGCNFIEDYSSFSSVIDLKTDMFMPEKIADIIEEIRGYKMTDPDEKLTAQLKWESYLKTQMLVLQNDNSELVNYWYVSEKYGEYFNDAANCEVFIKGLFGAFNKLSDEKNVFFATTNLPRQFLETFREVIVALSCKRFKSNIQLYFIDKSCNWFVQVIGNTIKQAVINAVEIAVEHGSPLFRPYDSVCSAYIASLSASSDSNDKIVVVPFDILVPYNLDSNVTIFEKRTLDMVEERIDSADNHGYKLVDTHTRLGSKVHIRSFYEMSFLFYRTTIANRIAFKVFKIFSKELNDLIDPQLLTIKPIMYYSYSSYSKAIVTSLVEITKLYLDGVIRKYNEMHSKLDEEELRKKIKHAQAQVAFASYQYNLQSETKMDAIQLYFSFSNDYSGAELLEDPSISSSVGKLLKLKEDINLVTIVPISSTLTTFDKMLEKLYSYREDSGSGNFILVKNFTAFWVGDSKGGSTGNKIFPSDIENDYWSEADSVSKCITIRTDSEKGLRLLNGNPKIYYLMRAATVWEHPLKCKLCFPNEHGLINEVPLVETDLTSTVPSQQIRSEIAYRSQLFIDRLLEKRRKLHKGISDNSDKSKVGGNNHRITLLRDCIYYGHIERGKNHFQYYISTQDFFYKDEVREEIREWLYGLKLENRQSDCIKSPKLKIIFSPEHNTNVGFAQYVNTYYFNGTAEIISINEDKEFRTNFICEHESIRRTIVRLHKQQEIFDRGNPVEFYFVDDNINTGDTIKKANSFLRSLIPNEYIKSYSPVVIKKCFLLVDRLSDASKGSLVLSGDPADCHAFVHIDVSHMRRQGDSCIGCKLSADTKRLFNRSPIKIIANYWAKKYLDLIPVDFDDVEEMAKLKSGNNAYERFVLSHIAQNFIFKDGVTTRSSGEYYDSIICIFELIISLGEGKSINKAPSNFLFNDLLEDLTENFLIPIDNLGKKENPSKVKAWHNKQAGCILCELLIKLLARPFFSYDFSFRNQMQTFLLILAECYLGIKRETIYINITRNSSDEDTRLISETLLNNVKEDNYKDFLLRNNRIKRTVDLAKRILCLVGDRAQDILYFYKDVLFESLADMKSTYLLRKSVIERVEHLVDTIFLNLGIMCDNSSCKCLLNPNQCLAKNAKKCFWITYYAHIHKIIDCNTDETHSLWFYYYMLTGEEITDDTNINCEANEVANLKSNIDLFLLTSSLERDTMETFKTVLESKATENKGGARSYYLSNFSMQRKWAKMNSTPDGRSVEWLNFLKTKKGEQTGRQDKNPISLRYTTFTDKLLKMLNELTCDKAEFYVAVLSAGGSEEFRTYSGNRINFEEIHILSDACSFKNTKFDIKQERYIIKDRILEAWNNDRCDLQSNGYHIELHNRGNKENIRPDGQNRPEYDDKHHIINDYHKPYVIIYFDNPGDSEGNHGIGRKLSTLSKVFLYVGINNSDNMENLPFFILRDILSCRDLIMNMLEDDFDGEIMQKHAKSVQEEIVITHERSASHMSTTDERGSLQVFGLGDVSDLNYILHPINPKKQIIKNNEVNCFQRAELWLLFQNYVNGQIARLFNRSFSLNNNTINDEDVPKLYLEIDERLESDVFKQTARQFSDLNISYDERFNMLKKVVHMHIDIAEDAKFFSVAVNGKDFYYNCEFIKCILFDIFFSAIKYATTDASFLPRVDNLIWYYNFFGPSALHSYVFLLRENENLIILNNVNSNRIDTGMCDRMNEEIYRRIHDPLDYGDGHMSLFTIRQFVLGMWNLNKSNSSGKDNCDTKFKYVTLSDVTRIIQNHNVKLNNNEKKYNYWFLTQLPIFMEDTDDEYNYLD